MKTKTRRKPDRIRNIVVVSDTHCGCRLGLCPPGGHKLDDGGSYMPSAAQLKVWGWWEEFWNVFVPTATKGEPFAVVFNGDAIDGVHHNSTTQSSHNLEDQGDIVREIFKPVVQACEGRLYWVRGTEAHVAKSAREEEAVAKSLGAIRNGQGQHARWELWLKLGGHLVHFLHHIGTTASSAHESSAVNAELSATLVESARWGNQPPSVIVRSHRHRSIEVRLPVDGGYATAVVTPAWQLKTPFTYKIAGARLAPPQIGGVVIRLDHNNAPFTQTFVRHVGRPAVVAI